MKTEEIRDEEVRKAFRITQEPGQIIKIVLLAAAKGEAMGVRRAELIRDDVNEIFAKSAGVQFGVLAAPSDKTISVPLSARKIYFQLMEHPQMGKLAVMVSSPFIKHFMGMLTQFAFKWGKMRLFSDEGKALAWLREKTV